MPHDFPDGIETEQQRIAYDIGHHYYASRMTTSQDVDIFTSDELYSAYLKGWSVARFKANSKQP